MTHSWNHLPLLREKKQQRNETTLHRKDGRLNSCFRCLNALFGLCRQHWRLEKKNPGTGECRQKARNPGERTSRDELQTEGDGLDWKAQRERGRGGRGDGDGGSGLRGQQYGAGDISGRRPRDRPCPLLHRLPAANPQQRVRDRRVWTLRGDKEGRHTVKPVLTRTRNAAFLAAHAKRPIWVVCVVLIVVDSARPPPLTQNSSMDGRVVSMLAQRLCFRARAVWVTRPWSSSSSSSWTTPEPWYPCPTDCQDGWPRGLDSGAAPLYFLWDIPLATIDVKTRRFRGLMCWCEMGFSRLESTSVCGEKLLRNWETRSVELLRKWVNASSYLTSWNKSSWVKFSSLAGTFLSVRGAH